MNNHLKIQKIVIKPKKIRKEVKYFIQNYLSVSA